jgi:hypothetical protein
VAQFQTFQSTDGWPHYLWACVGIAAHGKKSVLEQDAHLMEAGKQRETARD